jgi:hypothetical protein
MKQKEEEKKFMECSHPRNLTVDVKNNLKYLF